MHYPYTPVRICCNTKISQYVVPKYIINCLNIMRMLPIILSASIQKYQYAEVPIAIVPICKEPICKVPICVSTYMFQYQFDDH